jgi:hypothetical protein
MMIIILIIRLFLLLLLSFYCYQQMMFIELSMNIIIIMFFSHCIHLSYTHIRSYRQTINVLVNDTFQFAITVFRSFIYLN